MTNDLKFPMVEREGKRMIAYQPILALEIVEDIADGKLLKNITGKSHGRVSKQTFLQWVATVPELSKAYSAALQMSAHALEENALDAAEKLVSQNAGKDKIAATNTLISQYRWSATRRNPTKYSDKGDTKVVVPIQINTTLDMGKGSNIEVEDSSIYDLKVNAEDAEYSEVTDEPANAQDEGTREAEGEDAKEKITTKGDLKALLRIDEPSVGTERQPLLEAVKKKAGSPKGPRKRVLTPRIKT